MWRSLLPRLALAPSAKASCVWQLHAATTHNVIQDYTHNYSLKCEHDSRAVPRTQTGAVSKLI